MAPGDRAWIRAAIARARPEAARLIAEVDGLVRVGTFAATGTTLGVTRSHERGFDVDFNITHLTASARATARPSSCTSSAT